MTDLAQIRQAIKTGNCAGRDLWAVVDDVREQEGVSLEELSKRLGYCVSALQRRRRRATGGERLREMVAMFQAMGWELTLTAHKKPPEPCEA